MDEDIEDLVGDVKYTDSQKSVATTNMYSMDFDSSTDKNNSSGKETYVIELDDSGDSETYLLHGNKSVINLYDREHTQENENVLVKSKKSDRKHKTPANCVHKCVFVAQEIFTQTSKTIIELAEIETLRNIERKSLETQTSLISIKENKFVEQSLELTNSLTYSNDINRNFNINNGKRCVITCDQLLNSSLEDGSSKFTSSEPENDDVTSNNSDKIFSIIDDDSKDNVRSEEQIENQYENTSDFEDSNTDIEEDSLMEPCHIKVIPDNQSDTSEVTKSVDHDIQDLYNKLSESIDLYPFDKTSEEDKRKIGALTPLTEESTIKKESIDTISNKNNFNSEEKEILFTNNHGVRIKVLSNEDDKNSFKLPSLQNNKSCPNSPHLNFLFSINASKQSERTGALPTVKHNQSQRRYLEDRWEIGNKELASGEGAQINGNTESMRFDTKYLQLPPIHIEGHVVQNARTIPFLNDKIDTQSADTHSDSISIKNKIRELKSISRNTKKIVPTPRSRSISPNSNCAEGSRDSDVAEKGCEVLCAELSRRLRSPSWTKIADTLEDVPISLEKFWGVITEQRIADLIRLVSTHVESPRTQVARSACHTLASILKNTNYTKKPDFHEAVTILLTKTGSFSRPVRHAANVALDDVVSGVEFCHAVTAICIHGASHKSPLVRCASARLLVVSCALAGGGRDLLRARPPTATAARKYALRSLAALLEDKNTDTRKYAERLYSMLRPLANFEAYYLTDVNVEQASRQMKKYDQLLLSPPKEVR